MRVEIYTKPECSLCAEGEALLDDAQAELGFELVHRNILQNDEWFAAHRYFVPVVFIDGARALELRFTAEQLRAKLEAAAR